MASSDSDYKEIQFLRRLYPDLPEKEMREAEERYRRYLELRLRIFDRIEREKLENSPDRLTDTEFHGINLNDDV